MDYLRVYNAIVSEGFKPLVAISVVQIMTINMTLRTNFKDLKEPGRFEKRILKKASKALWELSDSDFSESVALWKACYDWEIGQDFNGLGGCTTRTFRELVADNNNKLQDNLK